jgi:type IV pilus assembly protein PilC
VLSASSMPKFTYKAIRKGETESYEETVEAADRFAVYAMARNEGASVISVHEVKKGKHAVLEFDLLAFFQRIKEDDKILFTRNLGAMLNAGLPISRALGVIERQSRKPKLKEVVQNISQNIQKGGSLSEGMSKHPSVFSKLVTSMVAAGEEAGTLADTLVTISDQLERVWMLNYQ